MPVCCCSCFHGVLTAAYPLTPPLLDANAEWSRVTLKRPKARRSCLCWPWSKFPGWAFTKLSLNLLDMCNCDLYQVLSSYNEHVCFCDKNTKHFLRFLHPVCVHVQTRVASLCKTVKVLFMLSKYSGHIQSGYSMSSRSVVLSWPCQNRPVTCFRVMIYQLRINNLDLYSLKCQLVIVN